MTTRQWFPNEQQAVDAVANLAKLGVHATVGYPCGVLVPNGTVFIEEWPVETDETPGDWLHRTMQTTELDEHDVGMSTHWDDA